MKQYLLMCDESSMSVLSHILKDNTVQFLEVQGVNLNSENKYNILVTPVIPPVNPVTETPPQGADEPEL